MKFNPDMLWQSIPKQVFAVQFTGDNLEEVKKFAEEHRFHFTTASEHGYVYCNSFHHPIWKGIWLVVNEDYETDVMSNEDFLSNYTKVKE